MQEATAERAQHLRSKKLNFSSRHTSAEFLPPLLDFEVNFSSTPPKKNMNVFNEKFRTNNLFKLQLLLNFNEEMCQLQKIFKHKE